MKTTRFHTMQFTLAVLTLIAASLACQMPTPVVPPTATQDSDPSPTNTPHHYRTNDQQQSEGGSR